MAKMARTWWGERFLDVLTISMDVGRLKRGRSYAGPNRILEFDINGHRATATIRGNINPYFGVYKEPRYKVSVQFRQFSAKQWDEFTKSISHNAAVISQLLMNQMPTNIETAFSNVTLDLLPKDRKDLIVKCSCPDHASPCKHVAGVIYKLASLLDRDPLLLFQLRGMEFAVLQKNLASSPLGQALIDQLGEQDPELEFHAHRYTDPRLETKPVTSLKSFWQGDSPLPTVIHTDRSGSVPAILIKRGDEFPQFWHRHNSFVEVMEKIYQRIIDKNKASL